jgi:acetyl-CoA/propionyl-CoA carboxylase biotin carboxyl carrier protein
MFRKVLVANRGEIALRIIRTLREMGITSVAAYSDADRSALFAQLADEAYRLGPAPAADSYLNVSAILEVAKKSGAEAIHPGYGFLAENAAFAEAVQSAGLTFIGPSPPAMRVMGDKIEARRAVSKLGVPVVPGSDGPVESLEEAIEFAERTGYPIAVKAAGGGGGRGIRVVTSREQMQEALEGARREASAYFKNPQIYLERYFHDPRHVEIQVLGDAHGNLIHLGERDCSVQRRHQKVIEESPSPAVDKNLRDRMGEAAIRAARSVDYSNAGTVEFLLTREGEFFFLEMNTRIQVEHPVTEMVFGIDIVREMILVAAGEPMAAHQADQPSGHAIEVRVNAEDPAHNFRPTPGIVTRYAPPGGPGIRVDSGLYAGYEVPGEYDSLVAKLIAWAPDREGARRRALRALREYIIDGISTTIPFASAVIRHPSFAAGEAGTAFLAEHGAELSMEPSEPSTLTPEFQPQGQGNGRKFEVEVNRTRYRVSVSELAEQASGTRQPRKRRQARGSGGKELHSPMSGTVLAVKRQAGDSVEVGEVLLVVEAMKMENEIGAHRAGTLSTLDVKPGDAVESGQLLAVIE